MAATTALIAAAARFLTKPGLQRVVVAAQFAFIGAIDDA